MEQRLQTGKASEQDLIVWLRVWLCREINIDDSQLESNTTFVQYGLDSVHAMMLVGDLEGYLERRLPPTLAWDYPTLEALAEHLARETDPTPAPAVQNIDSRKLLARLDELSEAELDALLKERQAAVRAL